MSNELSIILPNHHDRKVLLQSDSYPAQNRKGVAAVVSILKSADDRLRCSYPIGKLLLR